MDKAEYQVRLGHIKELVDSQDYEGALKIVQTVEWKRVKSVNTLCMVADIYEANGMLEDCKRILRLAYNRAPIGKTILSRLVELALKLDKPDEAADYYHRFIKAAPNDATKYLLKYKIYKAQQAPIEDLIDALRSYKDREYTERWAYELARLYAKAGMDEECVEECDDIILWFSEGVYVIRAMELKMKYTPLTPSQQEKYNNRYETTPELYEQAAAPAAPVSGFPQANIFGQPQEAQSAGLSAAAPEPEDAFTNTVDLQERLSEGLMKVIGGFIHNEDHSMGQEVHMDVEPETLEDIQEYHDVRELEPEQLVSGSSGVRREAVVTRPDSGGADIDFSAILEAQADMLTGAGEMTDGMDEAAAAREQEESPEETGNAAETPEVIPSGGAPEKTIDIAAAIRSEMERKEVAERETASAESEEERTGASAEEKQTEEAASTAAVQEAAPVLPKPADEPVPAEAKVVEAAVSLSPKPADKPAPAASEAVLVEPETVEAAAPAERVEEDIKPKAVESVAPAIQESVKEAEPVKAVRESVSAEPGPIETAEPVREVRKPVPAEPKPVTEEEPVKAVREAVAAEPKPTEEAVLVEPIRKLVPAEPVKEIEPVKTVQEFVPAEPGPIEKAEPVREVRKPVPVKTVEEAEPVKEVREFVAAKPELVTEMEPVKEVRESVPAKPEPVEEASPVTSEVVAASAVPEDMAPKTSAPEEVVREAVSVTSGFAKKAAPAVSEAEKAAVPAKAAEASPSGIPEARPAVKTIGGKTEAAKPEITRSAARPVMQESERETVKTAGDPDELDLEALLASEVEQMVGGAEKPEPKQEPEKDLITRLEEEADRTIVHEEMEKETPQDKRYRIIHADRPNRLTEEQKRLFTYFAKIPGMDEQILDALHTTYNGAVNKTSRHGNIAIMGRPGTGKTRLSEGLVRSLCKEFEMPAAKIARIHAEALNEKDVAKVVGKMAGGFLIIEQAGKMSPETIYNLSQSMEFRTDSMILLIEDDKQDMRQLLADYPEFAEKFDSVISIPVFTNDELVTFARTYAGEQGYKMDEMGVLALYTIIGDNQKEDEPVSVAQVKEMVDFAIRKASRGGRRFGRKLSGRQTDENNRIILYEKDFNIK